MERGGKRVKCFLPAIVVQKFQQGSLCRAETESWYPIQKLEASGQLPSKKCRLMKFLALSSILDSSWCISLLRLLFWCCTQGTCSCLMAPFYFSASPQSITSLRCILPSHGSTKYYPLIESAHPSGVMDTDASMPPARSLKSLLLPHVSIMSPSMAWLITHGLLADTQFLQNQRGLAQIYSMSMVST